MATKAPPIPNNPDDKPIVIPMKTCAIYSIVQYSVFECSTKVVGDYYNTPVILVPSNCDAATIGSARVTALNGCYGSCGKPDIAVQLYKVHL